MFLTSRFLHVLLLRLAFKFALPTASTAGESEQATLEVEQRQCNIWKNGIHWQNMDGVEAIVEVVEQNTAVVLFMGCLEESQVKCCHLRSAIINTILSVKEQYSAAVKADECLIHPDKLTTYPLQNAKTLFSFPIDALSRAIKERKESVTNKIGQKQDMIKVNSLLYFEPYSCLTEEIIVKLMLKCDTEEEVSDSFLRDCAKVAHPKVAILKKIFLQLEHECEFHTALVGPHDQYSEDKTHECFLIFTTWKKFTENCTYRELRNVLDSYSIFCGRNPLENEVSVIDGLLTSIVV